MKVLVSNDDGVGAPGLIALVRCLRRKADVTVVVPEGERSGVGHGITYLDHFWVERRRMDGSDAWVTSGTPADCVRWGLSAWCDASSRPDLVVSGMNRGHNCGFHVFYSGTVAGALEAAFCGTPAAAISMAYEDADRADEAAAIAVDVLYDIMPVLQAQPGCALNINVPRLDRLKSREVVWTTQSVVCEREVFELTRHDGPRQFFKPRFGDWQQPEEGSDRWAIAHGMVSVSRLRPSLSDGPSRRDTSHGERAS